MNISPLGLSKPSTGEKKSLRNDTKPFREKKSFSDTKPFKEKKTFRDSKPSTTASKKKPEGSKPFRKK